MRGRGRRRSVREGKGGGKHGGEIRKLEVGEKGKGRKRGREGKRRG